MQTLAEQPLQNRQPEQLDHELRIRTDTATWLAETLDGNMRTSFEFSFDGQELYGQDGGALTEIFDDAIKEAKMVVDENPNLLFELRRRLIERGELDDIKAMARGELYTDDGEPVNTIVVPSDFPPELMDAGQDVGGYNADRKQTMLRVITREENGNILMKTQSLDGSNRQALEAIYKSLRKQPQPGELLSQRINLNLPAEWQGSLINNLTDTYDNSMGEQYGGELYAGRRPADYRNTYDFVCSQQDLVDWFTTEKLTDPVAAEKLRYKLAATMATRYDSYIRQGNETEFKPGEVMPESFISVAGIAKGQSLFMELERESRRAAGLGKTFSGCGASVSAETDKLSAEDELKQSGYVNRFESKGWHGGRIHKNSKCVSCEKIKPEVGACHICKDCVDHPKKQKSKAR